MFTTTPSAAGAFWSRPWPLDYPFSGGLCPPGRLVAVAEPEGVGGTRGFLPPVEGMRACAAVGVVITHVAFQTAHTGGIVGRLFGRFDLAVAVFFALSGFLLWRGHAAAARGLRPIPATGHYLRSRLVRIMPAYLVAVVVILTLLPDAKADFTVWLANLSLTQIYVPLTLTAGLTQMWSLAVEVSFYLALPVFALLVRRVPVRARIPVLAAAGVVSLGWALIPFDTPYGVSALNWPPAFLSWFVAGMLLAELTVTPVGWPHRLARKRIADGRRRRRRVPDRRLSAGGSGRPHARHHAPVHRQDRDGRSAGRGTDRAAGVGQAGHPTPNPGQ